MNTLTTALRLAAVPSAVAAARSFTTDSLRLWQVPFAAVDDAALIVSELVTNAVRSGGVEALEPDDATLANAPIVGLQLTLTDGVLLIEVWDGATGVPELRQQHDDTEGGRGLFLVSILAERWGYYPSERGGKVVRAELAVSKNEEHDGTGTGWADGELASMGDPQLPSGVAVYTEAVADVAMLERVIWGMQRTHRM